MTCARFERGPQPMSSPARRMARDGRGPASRRPKPHYRGTVANYEHKAAQVAYSGVVVSLRQKLGEPTSFRRESRARVQYRNPSLLRKLERAIGTPTLWGGFTLQLQGTTTFCLMFRCLCHRPGHLNRQHLDLTRSLVFRLTGGAVRVKITSAFWGCSSAGRAQRSQR